MQIPTIKLSEASQQTAKHIIEASKNKINLGDQMKMANYYAYIHSNQNAVSDKTNYAKLLLGK